MSVQVRPVAPEIMNNFKKPIDGLYTAECDLDLNLLRASCIDLEKFIITHFDKKISEYPGKSSETTKVFGQYNLCLYPYPMIHDLYWNIHNMFHTCLTDHHGGRVEDKFVMQCWLNVYKKGEYIEWHSHTDNPKAWHGFFCVDVEPNSSTFYKWENDASRKDLEIEIKSKNNLMVLGLCNGDKHKSSVWKRNNPRITIAFDIIPQKPLFADIQKRYKGSYINAAKNDPRYLNHWIPI